MNKPSWWPKNPVDNKGDGLIRQAEWNAWEVASNAIWEAWEKWRTDKTGKMRMPAPNSKPVEVVQDGETWVWNRNGIPCVGDGVLNYANGRLEIWGYGYDIQAYPVPVFVRKIKRHTFGGVVFEETGPAAFATYEGFILNSMGRLYYANAHDPTSLVATPLRPVAIEPAL